MILKVFLLIVFFTQFKGDELKMGYFVKAFIDQKLIGKTWFYDESDAEYFAQSFEDLNNTCCAFVEEADEEEERY